MTFRSSFFLLSLILLTVGCASLGGPKPGPTVTSAQTARYRAIAHNVGSTIAGLNKITSHPQAPSVLVAPLVNRSGQETDIPWFTHLLRQGCAQTVEGKARFLSLAEWDQLKTQSSPNQPPAYEYLLTAEVLTGVVDGVPGQDDKQRVSFKLLERATSLLIWTETYELP